MATASALVENGDRLSPFELEEFRLLVEDPVDFAELFLGLNLWSVQKEILRSVDSNPQTVVKACHSSGKTLVAAAAVHHWLASKPEGIVLTTAPTLRQVKHLLWGDIRKIAGAGKIRYPQIHATQLSIGKLEEDDAKGNRPDEMYALGLTATEGVKFQGFHRPNVLICIDEAPGIRAEIWDAVEGIRASGDARILALGNPTAPSGNFYNAFTRHRASWKTFSISAFDTPNLKGLTPQTLEQMSPDELVADPVPYLVRRGWVLDCLRTWGEGHPLYQSKVLANFPEGQGQVFPLSWLEAARLLPNVARPTGQKRRIFAGLDVAGGGRNKTVLYLRDDDRLFPPKAWNDPDPRGEVVRELNAVRSELVCVAVDRVGIGHGMYLHLADLGFPVLPINVGDSPYDKDQYADLRAELFWSLRGRLKDGVVSGLADDETIAQLAQHMFRPTERGLIRVESKEKMAARGVESPDHADALVLCFGGDMLRPRIY